MLTIERLQAHNQTNVLNLSVLDAQKAFVGDIANIIEQSSTQSSVSQWVIWYDSTPVGFFLLDQSYSSRYSFCPQGSVGLRSFFIDQRYQGRGFARLALEQIAYHYSTWLREEVGDLYLTVNCKNQTARSLYLKLGFNDTQRLYLGGEAGPQHIMCFTSKREAKIGL
ncbi:hypothetical protein BCU70_06920 [Vibrio sp. 10N.286.49.C2]|uniref:GNAT family N-acetyltransferase n=1 Tax=unclassified Vibrio TaxID=2614977 RepID=UPI000C82CBA2|nr:MULTISPECIES: GNAT family N-acetyltransferase [unclassified Vibrio]PMH31616.1 hypothetical protein BCU70_06920 [Vibrio sp. 10N.286.49.C2]PMH50638.1 hypothetical protein BCU66_19280 [Vibrio sp. 10N.286.49.B1]PMH79305.1 hypothetical protein BCU58_05720 [Vibrio sp. 10N.286.48.B7]